MTNPAGTGAALPRPGDILGGKYHLEKLLGQGGMGAVFAAKHLELDKAVAIKVMLADTSNQEAMARFKNEGKAAARIDSEHVVKVFDVAQEFGFQYMVLELLEGEDLAQILERQGKLPPHVVVGYMLQGLRGVGKAHSKGIIHRDLKPSNLFLAKREDGHPIVKVLDFGISKASSSSPLAQAPSALTSTRAMLGSPLYMSPEQLRSSKSVDHRADIWAIGVIMYELLTGELPFGGENLGELFAAILENDAPSLRLKSPEVPEGLERVVLKCLQRRAENRYDNVAQIAQDLAPFEGAGAGLMATAYLAPPAGFGAPRAGFGAATPNPPLHQTPPYATPNPALPSHGAVTPSGLARPAPSGTVAMGRATGGGWQSTGSGNLPRSKAPLVFLACAIALGLAGAVTIGVVLRGKNKETTTVVATPAPPSAATSVEPPPEPPPQPPATPVSAAVAPAPPAPVTSPATGTPTQVGHTKPTVTAHHAPPSPPTPPAVVAKPVTTTKPTSSAGSGVQLTR